MLRFSMNRMSDEEKTARKAARTAKREERKAVEVVAGDLMEMGNLARALYELTAIMSRDEALRVMAPKAEPQVGDILYTSWGYDQTNVDFYQVVAVSTSKASVKLAAIHSTIVEQSRGCDYVAAVPGSFRNPNVPTAWHRVRQSDRGYAATIEDHSAWLWDGKPKYETSSGWGH